MMPVLLFSSYGKVMKWAREFVWQGAHRSVLVMPAGTLSSKHAGSA